MKSKKFLSLVLALVMALSLAIPAFAADAVKTGDEYTLDVSTATVAVADTNDDGTDDEWSITIAGVKFVLTTNTDADDGDIASKEEIAEWVAGATVTDWTVTVDAKDTTGKTLLFTAGADDATVPAGAKPVNSKLTSMDGLTTGSKTEIKTTTEVPSINVIIPNTGSAILNPYKLTVNLPSGDTADDQIISAPQFVKSTSSIDLKVNVTAVGKPSSGVEMASKPLTEKVVDKQVYMYLNTAVEEDAASAPASPDFPTAYDKATAALLSPEGGQLSNVLLPAPASNASYLAFRLEGEMTAAPTIAWTDKDKVDVTLTFTFVPVAVAA